MDEKHFLLQEKYNGEKTPEYENDLVRLAEGEPLAYVIGFVPFLSSKIYLDSRPLIPRPETEYWVEKAMQEISDPSFPISGPKTFKILDLFAGSGCIGVAILKHVQNARVDFGEIEKEHFPTIEKNLLENGIDESRFRIIDTDVFSNINDSYDYIFANPPYLTESRRGRVEGSVLEYEPAEALFAGEDGFLLIRKTIEGLPKHLNPAGALYIEHEPEHTEAILKYAQKVGFGALTYPDPYGVLRYSVLKRD
jgi:release factor glutamine methyltransferase